MTKPEITYDEFVEASSKLEIRIGQIVLAERIPKSNGLKLTVIFGPNKEDERTSFTNLGKTLEPEALLGLRCPFIMNIVSNEIKGVNSQVMIMVGLHTDGTIDLEDYEIGVQLM